MDTKPPITVLIADDHPVVSRGFSMALADFAITVVAQSNTPEDAYAQYVTLQPDVFIIDIRFGDKPTGLDIAKQVFEKYPAANVVFLSQFDQDNLIKESYRLGARAFLTKNCSPETLAAAVTEASEGKTFFTQEIAVRLANLAISGDSSPGNILTAKELKIFILMAKGKSNIEIAEAMDMSINSAQNKAVYSICKEIGEKLGVHNQADLTRLAIKHELITP